jgi:tetratricopeptide (TPR) repeat protein
LDGIPEKKYDSLFQSGQEIERGDDIPTALRIYNFLSRRKPENKAYVKAQVDLKARQDLLVSTHMEVADGLLRRGKLTDALIECRLALFAKPNDPALIRKVHGLEESVRESVMAYHARIARLRKDGDLEGAMAAAQRALQDHPSDSTFRHEVDSLQAQNSKALEGKMADVGKLIDAGQETRAVEVLRQAMSEHPDDPTLAQTFEELKQRIDKKRQRRQVDSLGKAFETSLGRGDPEQAMILVANLEARGQKSAATDRMRARVDSLRGAQQVKVAFDEDMAAARKALANRDKASAKAALEQALAKRPGNSVAKGLLESLDAPAMESKAPPKEVKPVGKEPPPSKDQQWVRKVNELVLAGISSYRAGDYKAALDRWSEALSEDPSNQEARKYVANVKQKLARLGQ